MATRSTITLVKDDGSWESIYCHWSGYPEWNGRILKNYYATESKVQELMNLGDLSALGESTEKPEGHTWANPMDGYCLAYHRDGLESFKIERGHDSSDIDIYMQDYNYIFQDGKWSCVDYYGKDVPI